MGRKGRAIVKLDVGQLIKELNDFIADEWLEAYYYWVCAQTAQGIYAPKLAEYFEKEMQEEIAHATKLARRVTELGGLPPLDQRKFYASSKSSYILPPKNPADVRRMLRNALKMESSEIEAYNRMAEKTEHKDPVTWRLMVEILEDEVREEQELEKLLAGL